ncbi:MAG: hypothetical protein PHH43_02230 [Candidatus Cloacimonetes bacterium]|nr:hypothetical protein [Candidatus Cloacimonadota bacterium]
MLLLCTGRFFPQLTNSSNDSRSELIFGDGIAYLKDQSSGFDIILVDSTDPVGPAEGLFRRAFIEDCHKALNPDGILCLQSESPWIASLQPIISQVNRDLKELFPIVAPYTAAIQTYQAGLWMFQLASKQHNPLQIDANKEFASRNLSCKYYTAALHNAAFVLPQFVNLLLS